MRCIHKEKESHTMLRLVFVFLLFESIFTETSTSADLNNEQLNRKIEALEDKYSKEFTSLKNEHMKEITSLKNEVAALRKITENGQKLDHRHGVRRLAGDQDEKVAFDAHLSEWIGNLGKNQPIKFNTVNTNIGNLYNKSTGVFYCDRSGTYVFFARFLAYAGKRIYLDIVKNGVSISPIYAYNPHTYGQSAATAVTHLQRGDFVWVETSGYQTNDLNGNILDTFYNSFGGFLLYSD